MYPYLYCQESPTEWDETEDQEREAETEREHQVIPLD